MYRSIFMYNILGKLAYGLQDLLDFLQNKPNASIMAIINPKDSNSIESRARNINY
jgi:hypothetical protein